MTLNDNTSSCDVVSKVCINYVFSVYENFMGFTENLPLSVHRICIYSSLTLFIGCVI